MVQKAEIQGVQVHPQSFWFGENPGNVTKKMIWKIRPAWKKRSRLFFSFFGGHFLWRHTKLALTYNATEAQSSYLQRSGLALELSQG